MQISASFSPPACNRFRSSARNAACSSADAKQRTEGSGPLVRDLIRELSSRLPSRSSIFQPASSRADQARVCSVVHVSVLLGDGSISITERYYAPWAKARQDRLVKVVRAANAKDPLLAELDSRM